MRAEVKGDSGCLCESAQLHTRALMYFRCYYIMASKHFMQQNFSLRITRTASLAVFKLPFIPYNEKSMTGRLK